MKSKGLKHHSSFASYWAAILISTEIKLFSWNLAVLRKTIHGFHRKNLLSSVMVQKFECVFIPDSSTLEFQTV